MGVFVQALPGCSDACEDMAETCALCTDEDIKGTCEGTVESGVQALCSDRSVTYAQLCPGTSEGGSTSVSTSSAGGTSTTTSSTGGSGGTTNSGGSGGAGGSSTGGAGGTSGGGSGGS